MIKYLEFVLSRLFGTGVDTLVLWICSDYLFTSYWGSYILSPIISFEFAVMSNFLWSYCWIWSSRIENKCWSNFWKRFSLFNLSSVAGFLIKMLFLLLFERIFGWDVKALSSKYRNFLDQFLPELKNFFEKRKLRKNVYFHCSDEPSLPHLPQFKKCAELLARHLDGWNLFDGGTLDVYKQGLIPIPIPIAPITTLEKFMDVEVKERWTAYCCFPQVEYVNRFIHMTSSRNRIFGAQLYRFKVEGFLHWGFNFYYSGLSLKPVDPYKDTCCYYTYPSGDAFLVYPRKDGVPEESLRLKVFGHALQDQRAMQLLETMIGRPKVEKILDKCSPNGELHMHDYPRGEKAVLALREKINAEIKKNLKKCAD